MKGNKKPPPDALKMFLHAHTFFQAQELIYGVGKDQKEILDTLAIPALTLSAFASELFFKCLLLIETGAVPQGHNLKIFFDQLSPKSREALTAHWDSYAKHQIPGWDRQALPHGRHVYRDIATVLSAGSRSFELLRYHYEDAAPDDFAFYLDKLPYMLGMVILDLKPEWRAEAIAISVVPPSCID